MSNAKDKDKEQVCRLEHSPCRSAYLHQVYDNARTCRQVTRKRCKADPTKKQMCTASKRGISRMKKKDLCLYIVGNPAFRSDDHVFKKQFEDAPTLKKELSETIQRELFTPMKVDMEGRKKGTSIGDAERALYLAKYSSKNTVIYTDKEGSKAYWTNYDEYNEEPLPDWRLSFPPGFERFVRAARRNGVEQIFLNMRLFMRIEDKPEEDSKHANFLLLDMARNLMYRYEPSSYGLYTIFNMDELDTVLTKWAKKHNLEYIPPWDSCPRQLFAKVAGLQRLAGKAGKQSDDPGGFCKVWATFMMEQKLRHPDMDMNDLQRYLVKLFIDNNIDISHFGRIYIERVNQFGNRILKAHGMKDTDDPSEYMESHWNALMKQATLS